jgi:predicted metal-dependent peptidase
LQHNIRAKQIVKPNHRLLNIAFDLEIAKHVYTPEDNDLIRTPRSPLAGGITTADCDKYPNCVYAEEFYEELKRELDVVLERMSKQANDIVDALAKSTTEDNQTSDISIDISVEIEKTKQNVDQLKRAVTQQAAAQQAQKNVDEFRPPKPTLASEIENTVRFKLGRFKSYRRPPKLELNNDLLFRGTLLRRKAAKIIVYVDRSGSFSPDKTAQATTALNDLLRKYRGSVAGDCIFFNDGLMHVDPGAGGGGTNYQAVINDIATANPELAVVITDDDSANIIIPPRLGKVLVVRIGCAYTNLAAALTCAEVGL